MSSITSTILSVSQDLGDGLLIHVLKLVKQEGFPNRFQLSIESRKVIKDEENVLKSLLKACCKELDKPEVKSDSSGVKEQKD